MMRIPWIPVALVLVTLALGCQSATGGGSGGAPTSTASTTNGAGSGGAPTSTATTTSGTGGSGGAPTSTASTTNGTGGSTAALSTSATASSSVTSGTGGSLSAPCAGRLGFPGLPDVPVGQAGSNGANQSVAVADLNGDGKPDLAIASWGNGEVSVVMGNGDGTFAGAVNYVVA